MVFNMKFVSDGLQTVFDMKIELRISPVHLYLVTPSDKIISIMEMEFMVYNLIFVMKMTVYCI